MNKRLTLLRHAKSGWDETAASDQERTLNARGEQDAPLMGRRMYARGARPSLLITSPAVRARQTIRLVAAELEFPIEFIHREDELYLADAGRILAVVQRQDDCFNDILLCAHNPGITEFARKLPEVRIDHVPTCGMIVIDTGVTRWRQLDPESCSLELFDSPRLSLGQPAPQG